MLQGRAAAAFRALISSFGRCCTHFGRVWDLLGQYVSDTARFSCSHQLFRTILHSMPAQSAARRDPRAHCDAFASLCQADVWRLPLVDGAETKLILSAFNDTAAEYPSEQCVHELLTAQAATAPGVECVEPTLQAVVVKSRTGEV